MALNNRRKVGLSLGAVNADDDGSPLAHSSST
jgi:hypothetical protein